MKYHQVINSCHLSDISFYDVRFALPHEKIKIFRILFLHFSSAAEDSFQIMAKIIRQSCEDVHGHIITFYDTAWDEIPSDERNGKTVFDKLFPQKIISRANYLRFFGGLTDAIEKFIRDKKPEIIYFNAFTTSHQKAYDRLLISSKSELIKSTHTNGRGHYVITTKYHKTPDTKGF
ncbi:hypothetical protein GE278_15755 [Enterobacteriaceae bacterium Kacie_13]|nr:hypothetical protein GE278_15755 [Enterobacteriaceae bacterium Kacie_13]